MIHQYSEMTFKHGIFNVTMLVYTSVSKQNFVPEQYIVHIVSVLH